MRQILCLLTAVIALQNGSANADWPKAFRMDANLYDICFIDAQIGWTVGDRGTILKTSDGGATWHLQSSSVDCRLESVHFLDQNHGWAVGGQTVPYTHRTLGVLLKTHDGGQTWTKQENNFLPWLTQVEFFDQQRGIVAGHPSAMYPSAVHRTEDSGKHWKPCSGKTSGGIFASFNPDGNGLLIERDGRLTRMESQRLTPLSKAPLGGALARQLYMQSARQGIICGTQGRIGLTRDGGTNWSKPENLVPDQWLAEYDWLAMAGQGQQAWIAGVPGSHVLHTNNGGRSWEVQQTGQSLPIFALHFADAKYGWAVGAMGTILATTDGGTTWHTQNGGPQRLAVTTIVSNIADIPWEFLAQATAGEGFLASIEVLSGPAPINQSAGTVPIASRLYDAATSVSCTGANVIQSLPTFDPQLKLTAAQISKNWDLAIGTSSREQLTEYLVRQFRLYRPEMVLIADHPQRAQGAFELSRNLVRNAIDQAADAQSYRSQIDFGGLKPWQVRQIATRTNTESEQAYRVSDSRLVLSMGQSNANLATKARSIVCSHYQPSTELLLFDIVGHDGVARNRRKRSRLFDSATLSRDERMHRIELNIHDNFRQMQRHAQQRRTVESLLRNAETKGPIQLQQTTQLLRDLPEQDRGDLMYQTAMQLSAKGQSADSFALLSQVAEMPKHRFAESASLLQFTVLSSEEGQQHWKLPTENQIEHLATAAFQVPQSDKGVRPATFEKPTQGRDASTVGPLESNVSQQRQTQALNVAKEIQLKRPDLYFEPMFRFPLAALHRRLGRREEAERFWRYQLANQTDPFWKSCAANEISLIKRNQLHTPTLHVCRLTQSPPFLDGELKDDTWTTASPMMLKVQTNGVGDLNTELFWAWDEKFLYLAARCQRADYGLSIQSTESRKRDADLSNHDRLILRLDTDRDYCTHWKLVIDDRGWAVDALNEDSSWDPNWYIAAHDDLKSWTIEAAIPWHQLRSKNPIPQSAWALGIQRIVPGSGMQSWCPGDTNPSEARFGMLVFE
ncbi:MAG: YCF48-related protein [Pirellulaceae bacterium]|nr:YCF48-related protein [Pirellulaceae bacterium]